MSDSAETMTEDQIKHMVNRFLMWKLPSGFSPDCGISFKPDFNEHTAYPMRHEPVGTNLFDAQQATEMVRYMLDGLPTALSADGGGESRPATSKQRIKTTTVHEERTTSVAAAGDKAGVAPGPSDSIPSPDKVQHWAVEVRVDGVGILTIESECLSGIPNIDDYAVIVRRCAAHLNAFIGDEPNETAGGFPVAAAPYQAEETGVISGTRQDPQHGTPHGSGVTAGETAPIPSQPDEREAIARVVKQVAFGGLATDEPSPLCYRVATAILAMQAERRGAKQDIVDLAKDLVALWTSPKISGLPRSERNAAIEDTRNAMIEAVGNLARSSVGSEQGSSNSEVTGSSPVAPATNAAVAQSAEQPFCKGTVSGSSPDGGTNTQPAPIAGLEPVASLLDELREYTALRYAGDCKCGNCQLVPRATLDRAIQTMAQLEAHAAEQVRAEREACASIIDARCAEVLSRQYSDDPPPTEFEQSVNTNLRLIAALLPDLSAAIRARGQV